jgi:hypothetical protein
LKRKNRRFSWQFFSDQLLAILRQLEQAKKESNDLADRSNPSGNQHNREEGLGVRSAQLKVQLDDLSNRMAEMSQRDGILDEHIREDLNHLKLCLDICTKALL